MKERLWISDLDNGTFENPILFGDYSDPDVIRVGETYFLTASSFNYTPGLPILVSNDLVNWKLVNYALKNLHGSSIGNINYDIPAHSKGVWAPAIRFREGTYYIYYGMPDDGIFMVKTQDPYGEWEEPVCVMEGKGYIDPCPYWEEDGNAYIIHAYAKSRIGFKSFLGIFQMSEDGTKAIGTDHILFDGVETQPTIEGPKVYKREEYYYIFAPAGGVKYGWQTILRSKSIFGPFEEKIVLHQGNTDINGPHQGGLVSTLFGDEWFLHFQDRGAYGRISHLQPVTWENGWPLIGCNHDLNGCGEPCLKLQKPKSRIQETPLYLEASDDFLESTLNHMWQWTGNGYPEFYSFTENPGKLRLYSKNPSGDSKGTLWRCANILTQKLICPQFRAEIKMNTNGLTEGERAGVTVFGGQYGYLCVRRCQGILKICYGTSFGKEDSRQETEDEIMDLPCFQGDNQSVYFTITMMCDNQAPLAKLRISVDGEQNIGGEFIFRPADDVWVGAKIGLFSIADNGEESGYADFDYIHVKKGLLPEGFSAAEAGDFQKVKWVVEYSKDSMNERDEEGRNILHYGVKGGNQEIVEYLVKQVGISPVKGDKNLVSPMELAVTLRKTQIVEYFETLLEFNYEDMYHNPIRTGMFPDPSIVRVEDDYYMVNSTFLYFPCIPVSHSKDLIHWKIIGHAITNPKWSNLAGLECGRGFWAPDISYHNGIFYITVTYRMNDQEDPCRKQIIVSSKKPEGPYGEPVIIEEDGIDPSLFWSKDDRCYMLLNRGARILELSKDANIRISETRLIYYGDYKRAPEGPHLLEKDGYFYLFLAEGGTGILHRITVARASNLYGPYEPCPYNPIMTQDDPEGGIQRCGHGKPVSTPDGRWYMVYLCGRLLGGEYSVLGRETALDPITWTKDGWPIVNQLQGPSVLQKNPLTRNLEHPDVNTSLFIEGWMTVREPEEEAFQISNEWTYIKGSSYEYHDIRSRNILVQRRTGFHFSVETALEVPRLNGEQRLGMIGYYDENSWFTFGIIFKEGIYVLELKEHIGLDTKSVWKKASGTKSIQTGDVIYFKIVTNGMLYGMYYKHQKKERWQQAFALPKVSYLSDEGVAMGKRFTGTTMGVFVYQGQEALTGAFQLF